MFVFCFGQMADLTKPGCRGMVETEVVLNERQSIDLRFEGDHLCKVP